jgi:hypothetical protein
MVWMVKSCLTRIYQWGYCGSCSKPRAVTDTVVVKLVINNWLRRAGTINLQQGMHRQALQEVGSPNVLQERQVSVVVCHIPAFLPAPAAAAAGRTPCLLHASRSWQSLGRSLCPPAA